MRILIVDNTMDPDSWGAPEFRAILGRVAAEGGTVSVRRAPQEDLPASPRGFDRIILTGSRASAMEEAPWVSKLREFTGQALDEGTPLLGVCYGHQLIASVLASGSGKQNPCHAAPQPEIGWTKIELTTDSPLFDGLPAHFYSFSRHFEEVDAPPPGTRLLARSPACAVQSFQLEGRPVYGIQFHPERDLAGAQRTLREFQKAIRKKKPSPSLLHPDLGKKLYDPKVGETIFRNFVK